MTKAFRTLDDVDVKGKKQGEATFSGLELQGFEFPPTRQQKTPSGGRHLIYSVATAVRRRTSSPLTNHPCR